jgi:hypothetical protein
MNRPSAKLGIRSAASAHRDWRAVVGDGRATGLQRFPAIAAAAQRLRLHSFTLGGEAVVVGPDGLSRFATPERECTERNPLCIRADRAQRRGSAQPLRFSSARTRWRTSSSAAKPASCTTNTSRRTAFGVEGIVSRQSVEHRGASAPQRLSSAPNFDQAPQRLHTCPVGETNMALCPSLKAPDPLPSEGFCTTFRRPSRAGKFLKPQLLHQSPTAEVGSAPSHHIGAASRPLCFNGTSLDKLQMRQGSAKRP